MKIRIFYFVIFLSFLSLGYYIYKNFSVTEEDIKLYHELMDRKATLTSCEALKRKPFFQNRENVQKDIFLVQNDSRLHYRIFSEKSSVKLTEKKDNIEFVENMENIKCLAQDKIMFDEKEKKYSQQLRYFTAKKGTYSYPSHKFITDSINLSFFETPGDTLPENIETLAPNLKGYAKEVSFFLTDKTPNLNASHFRATFDPEKELR